MEHKENILKLRADGKSYREIAKELGCAKSTVVYHCGDGQKEKTRNRNRKSRKTNPIAKKVDNFKHPGTKYRERRLETVKSNPIKLLRHKADDFQRREGNKIGKRNINFTYHDVIQKFGTDICCYLTGRKIDIDSPRTYNFDHVIPAAKGGDNSLENLGICCRDANASKNDLSVEEFIQLCKEVLEYNGYMVTQNED